MARVMVEGADIVVRLSWREKLAARRREVRVPVSALRQVYVEPDWWRALRGETAKGVCIPARLCVGTRVFGADESYQGHQQDFAAVRADTPVLCVDLRRTAPFSRLAVSVPYPDEVMRALRPFAPRDRLG
jgi:hypothetical protein